ncbi:MAG: substrate-binding domain-containing protein, partial [Anaerolineae bacterium]|nr:substrate-binding domain-containing protein [Anaerolineae bacterium]
PPNAIFCASDLIAMGAIDAASELGVNIPEQLGLVGFDDIEMAAWPGYAITTVKQPIEDLVDATIEVLLNAIENPSAENVTRWMPARLVQRDTTRRV